MSKGVVLCRGSGQDLEPEMPPGPYLPGPGEGAQAGEGAGQTPRRLCRWGRWERELTGGRVCPRGDLTSGGCLGVLHESHPPPCPLAKGRRGHASSSACSSPSFLLQHVTHGNGGVCLGAQLCARAGVGAGSTGQQDTPARRQPSTLALPSTRGDRAGWGRSSLCHRRHLSASRPPAAPPPPTTFLARERGEAWEKGIMFCSRRKQWNPHQQGGQSDTQSCGQTD